MKTGLGLYRHMLTHENFQFAKQAGATHIVAHLVDYFNTDTSLSTASGKDAWGISDNRGKLWSYEELRDLRNAINAAGLELAAIENFDPSHWHDILLDGPQKTQQIEDIKTIIRNMGRAGIPVMGYYFSLAGVWGRVETNGARGAAPAVGYVETRAPKQTPIPRGTVWNMVYDPAAPEGVVAPVSEEEMWDRLTEFLTEVVPAAEEAGVRLAAHPDDPPLPELRGTGRMLYHPDRFDRLLSIIPSHANALELCLGTVGEMQGSDIYATVEKYSRTDQIGYIHFRNVRGKVPNYEEVFIDEGDVDMLRVLRILHETNYDGVLIPDHTPQMACAAPWHAGMAYALGYMNAAIKIFASE
jgi:mannonate dehydratase